MPIVITPAYGSSQEEPSIINGDIIFHYDSTNTSSYTTGAPSTSSLSGGLVSSATVNTGVRDVTDPTAGSVWETDRTTPNIGIGRGAVTGTNIGTLLTYEMWVNLADITGETAFGYNRTYFLDCRKGVPSGSSTTPYYFLMDRVTGTNNVNFISEGGFANKSSTVTFPLNEWVHVAYTRTTTNVTYYMNGALISSHTTTTRGAITLSTFIIGGAEPSPGTYAFSLDGKFAISRFYSKTLSASEINQNYQAERVKFGV